jgi:hypothetical protein
VTRHAVRPPRPLVLIATTLLLAGAGGLALGAAAGLWGRTPAGNTALVVPFAGGPALLAAGWTVLTLGLRHREASRARLAAGAGLSATAALVASLLAIFTPVMQSARGATDQASLFPLAIIPPLALAVLAGGLLATLLAHPPGRRGWAISGCVALLAAIGLSVLPGIGYLVEPLLLPLLVALPVLAGRARTPGPAPRWSTLGLACAALPLVIIAGLQLGGYLVALGPAAGARVESHLHPRINLPHDARPPVAARWWVADQTRRPARPRGANPWTPCHSPAHPTRPEATPCAYQRVQGPPSWARSRFSWRCH